MLKAGGCSVGVGIQLLHQRQIGGRRGIERVYTEWGELVLVCLGGFKKSVEEDAASACQGGDWACGEQGVGRAERSRIGDSRTRAARSSIHRAVAFIRQQQHAALRRGAAS